LNVDFEIIGKRIKERRKQLHLSQEKLAEMVDKSTVYISNLENGKRGASVESIYTHISQHTCVRYGKINVPIFDDGWVSPYCPACFKEYRKSYTGGREETDEDIRKFIIEDTDMTRNVRLRSYDGESYSVRSIDCSDTLKRLGFDPALLPYAEEEQDGGSTEGEE